MIKIFGKVRYHWQPEMSVLVIYWSLSVIPIFIGLALMYESSSVPTLVLFSFFLFMVCIDISRFMMTVFCALLRQILSHQSRLIFQRLRS